MHIFPTISGSKDKEIMKLGPLIESRKFYIGRNNNKVDNIETLYLIIADLLS